MKCQLLTAFFCAAAAVAGAGCRRTPAPPEYNHLRVQLISGLLEAMADGDHETASAMLQRLRPLSDQLELIDSLAQGVRNRMTLERIDAALERGAINDGIELADAAVAAHGRTRELVRRQTLLAGLSALQAYLDGGPYPDADAAERAFQAVLRNAEAFADVERFEQWRRQEAVRLAERRRQERLALVRELMHQADPLIAAGNARAEVLMAEMSSILPEHPIAALRSRVLAAPETLNDLIAALDPAPREIARSLELFGLWYWNQLPEDVVKYLQRELPAVAPQTLSGIKLRSRLAARDGDHAQALKMARQYLAESSVPDVRFVGETAQDNILPARQFRAHVWRVPFPSVSNILNRLVQMQDYRARSE